jgi:acetyl esterase/lipase
LVERFPPARAAGVDVTLQRFDGMPHVSQFFASFLPEARDAIQGIASFVRDRTAEWANGKRPAR